MSSIKDIGYMDFFNHPCVCIQDGMDLILVPQKPEDNILPLSYIHKDRLSVKFTDSLGRNCVASVKQIHPNLSKSIVLELDYIAKTYDNPIIDEFKMIGNEIDEFFSPIEYYYYQKRNNDYSPSDLLYNNEIAYTYCIDYESVRVTISLVYGDILSNGIRSDLTVHPQLIIHFDKPQDLNFVFRFSQAIEKLLQFVLRKRKLNLKQLELLSIENDKKTNIGYLFSSLYNTDLRPQSRADASFRLYGTKIANLIELIASDIKFPVNHLSKETPNPYFYSTERFGALCSAFEYEYSMNNNYKTSKPDYDRIKAQVINSIDSINTQEFHEKQFCKEAIQKVQSIGQQQGFSKKIINAYKRNNAAFESSIDRILYREKDINIIARQIASLRGKVLHNEMGYKFNEQETEAIRFLEILQFVMTLNRATFTSTEIEIIIGALYYCNDRYINSIVLS